MEPVRCPPADRRGDVTRAAPHRPGQLGEVLAQPSSSAAAHRCPTVTPTAAIGTALWSNTGAATDAVPDDTRPSSMAHPRRRTAARSRRSAGSESGPRPVRSTKASRSGNSARTCSAGRWARIDRSGRGQRGRQSDADLGDQGRPTQARLVLGQVQRLRTVQDAEVGGTRRPGTEPGQHRAPGPLQRLTAQVGRADLEGHQAETPAAFGRQVDGESGGGQFGQQLIGGRTGQTQLAGDGAGRHRSRPGAEQTAARPAPGAARVPAARPDRGRSACATCDVRRRHVICPVYRTQPRPPSRVRGPQRHPMKA